jgi:hypothetical protein
MRAFLLSLILYSLAVQAAPKPECVTFAEGEKPLTRESKVLVSKSELEEGFRKKYDGVERLKARAFWSASRGVYLIPYSGSAAVVSDVFIQGVTKHVSTAIKNRYADAVYYSDFGHAHLLLPESEWQQIKTIDDPANRMTAILKSSSLKALYHTVENVQLKEGDFTHGAFPQDPWKLWRYFSRNLLGSFGDSAGLEVIFAGPDALYNTVRDIPGMANVSTIYISANRGACFPYAGDKAEMYFDLTFETIPYEQQ